MTGIVVWSGILAATAAAFTGLLVWMWRTREPGTHRRDKLTPRPRARRAAVRAWMRRLRLRLRRRGGQARTWAQQAIAHRIASPAHIPSPGNTEHARPHPHDRPFTDWLRDSVVMDAIRDEE
jgi:hypothetical protein